MQIGKVIKEARMHAGVTQTQIAQALGLTTPQYISNVERGIAPLSPKHFRKIAKMIKTSPERLLCVHLEDYERELRKQMRS